MDQDLLRPFSNYIVITQLVLCKVEQYTLRCCSMLVLFITQKYKSTMVKP